MVCRIEQEEDINSIINGISRFGLWSALLVLLGSYQLVVPGRLVSFERNDHCPLAYSAGRHVHLDFAEDRFASAVLSQDALVPGEDCLVRLHSPACVCNCVFWRV